MQAGAARWEVNRWEGDRGGQQEGMQSCRKSFQMSAANGFAESLGSGEGLRGPSTPLVRTLMHPGF